MLRAAMEKVLIVGTGITGAITASMLRGALPEKCSIHMVDKSRGSGGRMGTSRSTHDGHGTVDLGAQYISCTPQQLDTHKQFYDELKREDLLKPFHGVIEGENKYSDNMEHFIAPAGIGSLPKYFLKKSRAAVKYGQLVEKITKNGSKWEVSCSDGWCESYDCVILTMPVPQLLQLQGSLPSILGEKPDIKQKLEKVSYSARFALGIFYSHEKKLELPWTIKYINDNPVVKYIAVDDKKRNAEITGVGSSIAVHTTVPFGIKHLEGDKDIVCSESVLPKVREILPNLPVPDAVKNHKWRYSQVYKGYEGRPGCVELHRSPLLLVGGDAFTTSTLHGCLESSVALTSRILQQLNSSGL